jgi:hypothetical protein
MCRVVFLKPYVAILLLHVSVPFTDPLALPTARCVRALLDSRLSYAMSVSYASRVTDRTALTTVTLAPRTPQPHPRARPTCTTDGRSATCATTGAGHEHRSSPQQPSALWPVGCVVRGLSLTLSQVLKRHVRRASGPPRFPQARCRRLARRLEPRPPATPAPPSCMERAVTHVTTRRHRNHVSMSHAPISS